MLSAQVVVDVVTYSRGGWHLNWSEWIRKDIDTRHSHCVDVCRRTCNLRCSSSLRILLLHSDEPGMRSTDGADRRRLGSELFWVGKIRSGYWQYRKAVFSRIVAIGS